MSGGEAGSGNHGEAEVRRTFDIEEFAKLSIFRGAKNKAKKIFKQEKLTGGLNKLIKVYLFIP